MSSVHSQVEQLLIKNNITKPPVDVYAIAKSLNIIVVPRPYKAKNKLASMLIREGGKNIIAVNSDHDKQKQRFSVAHEIGHFLLHPGEKLFVDREFSVNFRDSKASIGKHIQEIEANRFASKLLIPERYLIADLRAYHMDEIEDNYKISRELSKKYDVSMFTMNIRINSLLDELKEFSGTQNSD